MKAITVVPGHKDSARLDDVPEPAVQEGAILVDALALGICGTDKEIVGGEYGWAPDGAERLILGHESFGRVREAPDGAPVAVGDLVVGIVRRPDPVPCSCCAADRWDLCRNGQYTERGIKSRHGYGSERWRVEPDFAVKVDDALADVGMLVEPASILAKAWERIDAVVADTCAAPERALVTGAGPIGLLAALMGRQRGLEVTVLDQVTLGPKPALVEALGATYHAGSLDDLDGETDVVVECTGAGELVVGAMGATRPDGIVCLTGVSSGGREIPVDAGELNRDLVLENDVVFGSVNAARRHYEQAVAALTAADHGWLSRVVSRRVPVDSWAEALERRDDDVKVVVEFSAGPEG
jgi:threonine dehydrogenase-like Zn-dependent dehydrogenase